MTPELFEEEVRQLCTGCLSRVRYYELPGSWPSWGAFAECDTAEQGLDIVCGTRTFHVTWDNTFFSYGLRVQSGALLDRLRAALVTDVSGENRWAPLVGQRITNASVYWGEVQDPQSGEVTQYPQDIVLTFETGAHVFLSAATYQEATKTLLGMSDNVVVIFDEQVARRLQVGPFV